MCIRDRAKPIKNIRKITIDGIKISNDEPDIPAKFNSFMSYITNVPVAKYIDNIPIIKKAPEVSVNIKNFIAEYWAFPEPQIDIKKYIGINSASQKTNKSNMSREENTPVTTPCKINNHIKYSRSLKLIFREAITAQKPKMPVSKTRGALKPSTPTRYWALKDSNGIHESK